MPALRRGGLVQYTKVCVTKAPDQTKSSHKGALAKSPIKDMVVKTIRDAHLNTKIEGVPVLRSAVDELKPIVDTPYLFITFLSLWAPSNKDYVCLHKTDLDNLDKSAVDDTSGSH